MVNRGESIRISTSNGSVFWYIMLNQCSNKYQIVDLFENIIYKEEFDSIDEARSHIDRLKQDNIISNYQVI